jgi:glutathione synthase/RimK-type ligase-like ATP-grasp enzyme
VSLLNNRIVSAYLKRPPAGTPADDLRPDWSFERVDVLPRAVVSSAREATHRIGLDYAGVDVIEDPNGRTYCLEANAAPGMSEQTLRSLYAHVQQVVRDQLHEAR